MSLVQRFERRVLYFLRRFESDQDRALDALQEVWLAAWKNRGSLRCPDAFRAWIYRIAHGKVVEAIRSEARRRRTERHAQAERRSPAAAPGAVDSSQTAVESMELVHFALSRLSPEHREVLTLRFLEGMTIGEIAAAIDCPEGTVKSRLHYAGQEIVALIEEQEHAGQRRSKLD
jgi:RNA polymerase sigma-70 factor (ECF subfamily)